MARLYSIFFGLILTSHSLAQTDPKTMAEAIAKGKRDYSVAMPFPLEAPEYYLREAVDTLQYALHAFGESRRARLLLARCALRSGRYDLAVKQFQLLGLAESPDGRSARQKKQIAASIRKRFPKSAVQDIQQVPGSGLWAAYFGEQSDEGDLGKSELVLFSFVRGKLIFRGKLFRLDKPGAEVGGEVYLMRRTIHDPHWSVVLIRSFSAADCAPAKVDIFTVANGSLHRSASFKSLTTCRVEPPKAGRGLTVFVDNVFKNWWPDAYEWRKGSFVLANPRHRNLYDRKAANWWGPDADHEYWLSMKAGALDAIYGDYQKSLRDWKRAERTCIKTIKAGGRGAYQDSGFFGDDLNLTLAEIRRRITWLKRKDYSHALLYRPYDFALQVKPFKLGPGHGSSQ